MHSDWAASNEIKSPKNVFKIPLTKTLHCTDDMPPCCIITEWGGRRKWKSAPVGETGNYLASTPTLRLISCEIRVQGILQKLGLFPNILGEMHQDTQQALSPSNDDTYFYEGCGREGPIRCIFLCEFHPTAGPKIACQVCCAFLFIYFINTNAIVIFRFLRILYQRRFSMQCQSTLYPNSNSKGVFWLCKFHQNKYLKIIIISTKIFFSNVLGHKITGFPISISNKKYARNAFYFNLCFVCDAWARTVQYEGVVKKLAEYFVIFLLQEQVNIITIANFSTDDDGARN